MRFSLTDSVVLITGASSGLGAEFARQLAPRVRALVLLARRSDRLEALTTELRARRPELVVRTAACDITDRAALDAALEAAQADVGPIDVLINNAGLGDFGVYDLCAWDKTARMIDVNVVALAYLTRKLLAPMVTRGRGAILNVSSGYGLQFMPGFAAYIGTKHFVTAFTESLRLDLIGTGVTVTQLCPGPVTTEFESNAVEFDAPTVPAWLQITPQACVTAALRGLERGRAMVVPGVLMKTLLGLGALSPRALRRLVYAPLGPRIRAIHTRARPRSRSSVKDGFQE